MFYPIASVWALVRSTRLWRTLLWMVVSWVATLCLLLAMAVIFFLSTGNSNAGEVIADYFTIPSFLVPTVVGVVHSQKHRKKRLGLGVLDSEPQKGIIYTPSELEAMKDDRQSKGQVN